MTAPTSVAVFGGSPRLGVPTLWGDVTTTGALGPAEDADGREDRFAVQGASHVIIVTRREWRDEVRTAATLLRAHDPDRHIAVLTTAHLPLAVSLITGALEGMEQDPGRLYRRLERQLTSGHSGLWVRHAGRLPRRVPLGRVVGSWFRPAGTIVSALTSFDATDGGRSRGSDMARGRAADWAAAVGGAGVVRVAGEVPERVSRELEAAGVLPDLQDQVPSPGARALAAQDRAFEFAALELSSLEDPLQPGTSCRTCGAEVVGPCPYCHASWGVEALSNERTIG